MNLFRAQSNVADYITDLKKPTSARPDDHAAEVAAGVEDQLVHPGVLVERPPGRDGLQQRASPCPLLPVTLSTLSVVWSISATA